MRSTHTEERWRLHSLPFDVCTSIRGGGAGVPQNFNLTSASLCPPFYITMFGLPFFCILPAFGMASVLGLTLPPNTAMNFPQFFSFAFWCFLFCCHFCLEKVLSLLPHTLDHLVATTPTPLLRLGQLLSLASIGSGLFVGKFVVHFLGKSATKGTNGSMPKISNVIFQNLERKTNTHKS